MHPLIAKLLQKRRIEKVEDLEKSDTDWLDEKETFDKWEKVLATKEVTMENLVAFLENQLGIAINQVADPDNTDKKDAKLKAMITIYNALLGIIKSPKVEKEQLEKYLEQLLKQ